jgi:BolA protein
MKEIISQKLAEQFLPTYLNVRDDSHLHAGHRESTGGATHFKVTIVSDKFDGQSLVNRHRQVYACLKQELAEGIHALAIESLTETENNAQSLS